MRSIVSRADCNGVFWKFPSLFFSSSDRVSQVTLACSSVKKTPYLIGLLLSSEVFIAIDGNISLYERYYSRLTYGSD